ncbi:MAG: YdbL family protein, partial [Rickettsiales bacterium]|nr:YdbL family protein [Rickettsiales bacterium]
MRISALAALLAFVIAAPAFALDLHAARADGLVGERADGYVEVLDSKAGGVSA